MTYKEYKPDKLYYTIGEVADLLGENTSLVRFWSQKFPEFIKPARNKKGNRLFTQTDVSNIRLIYYLVKERGMTLEGAYNRMKDNKDGVDRRVDIVESLTTIKERLQEIQKSL